MKLFSKCAAFIFIAAFAFGLSAVTPSASQASDYTMTVSSYVPTASVGDFALGAYPNITGPLYPATIILTNSAAVVQTVTIYDVCTSSTAAHAAMSVVLDSTGTKVIELPRRLMKVTSPGITKSSASSVVTATIVYE